MTARKIGEFTIDRVKLLEQVARLAGRVVLETPARRRTHTCYVSADLIADIEVALVAAGYDMKEARKQMNARLAEDEAKRPPPPEPNFTESDLHDAEFALERCMQNKWSVRDINRARRRRDQIKDQLKRRGIIQ